MVNDYTAVSDAISVRDQTSVLGGLLWLCGSSDLHVNYPVGLLLARVTVSIELDQYRYYQDDQGVPIAFCNWALLSDEMLEAALRGEELEKPDDWRSGSHWFFVELIAPFGHCRAVVRDLRQSIVPPNARTWSTRGTVLNETEGGTPRVQRFRNMRPVASQVSERD